MHGRYIIYDMGMNLELELDKWMEQSRVLLVQNYERRGQMASGAFGEGLRVETNDNHSSMYAPNHVWFMVNGRKPNKDQDPHSLWLFARKAAGGWAKEWLNNKGLTGNAFALAYNIGMFGITVPNKNNDGKLLEETFTEERYTELYNKILFAFSYNVTSSIKQIWDGKKVDTWQ